MNQDAIVPADRTDTHHRLTLCLFGTVFLGLMVLSPEAFAQVGGGPWTGTLQQIVDILTGTAARLFAIICVAGLGFAALTGRLSFFWAGSIIGGIVIIFGAPTIVDLLQGSVGA